MKRPKATAANLLATKYESIKHAWETETDRGLALVMAAYFDDLLDELLRRSLIDDNAVVKRLLDSDRAVSTFSARIDLAYAMGLITKGLYKTLHQIREIRNHFAHVGGARDFNDTGMKDRCDALHALDPTLAKMTSPADHSKMKFIAAVSLALMEFQVWIRRATHAVVREMRDASEENEEQGEETRESPQSE